MNQVLTVLFAVLLVGGCLKMTRAETIVEHSLSIDLGVMSAEGGSSNRFSFVVGATNSLFLLASPLKPDVMIMNMEGELQETLRDVVPADARIVRFITTSDGTFGLYSDGILPFTDEGVAGEYVPFNSARYGLLRWYAINGSKVLIVVMPSRGVTRTMLFDMESRTLTVGERVEDPSRYFSTVAPLGDGFFTAWSTDGPILGQIVDLTGAPVGEPYELWRQDGGMPVTLSSQVNHSGGVTVAFMEPNRSYPVPSLLDVSTDGSPSTLRRYNTSIDHGSSLSLSQGSSGTVLFWEYPNSSSDFRTGVSTKGSIRMELVDVNDYPKYHRFVVNGRISQVSSAVCNDKLLVVALAWIQDENEEFVEARRVAGVFNRTELASVAPESQYVEQTGVSDVE